LNRAHVCPLFTFPGYVVRSIVLVPDRSRTWAPPSGREFDGRGTWRYSDPDPKRPSTCVVKVKTVVQGPALRTSRTQPFRETDVARGFASSAHSGFGRGETSLIT